MKVYKDYLILSAAIIVIPIALNCIILSPNPTCLPVIGGEENWLLFWGSYLGGILTAGFGYYGLLKSDKEHKREIRKQEHERILLVLKNELSKRIEALNFSILSRSLPRIQTGLLKEEIDQEIVFLKERVDIVAAQIISWSLQELGQLPSKPSKFDETYILTMGTFRNDAEKVCTLLAELSLNGNSQSIKDQALSLKKEIDSHLIGATHALIKLSKEWIESEVEMESYRVN